jgi:hypothetical protein
MCTQGKHYQKRTLAGRQGQGQPVVFRLNFLAKKDLFLLLLGVLLLFSIIKAARPQQSR